MVVRAVAIDDAGNVSTPVERVLDRAGEAPPQVWITQPMNGMPASTRRRMGVR